jgi:magnesium-transporting ATPase (P-type)
MPNASLKPSTWHTLDLDALTKTLETSEHGLTSTEATARLERYGPNTLPSKPPLTIAQITLDQFRSPLIYILGAAAVVSLLIKEPTDAAFIAGVLVLNALIGGYQEWKAQASSMALQKLLRIRATVLRDGEAREVGAEELVPGDVVWLESGNRVPADLRLSSANGLAVDESLLTGESYPVTKEPAWVGGGDVPLADRLNMAHAGSIVTRGRAKGWVVATGKNTAVGQLAVDVIAAQGGKPPLVVRMERFTRAIALAMLGASALLLVVGVFLRGFSVIEMFLVAVALAVAAIPEGLPVAMTVALSVATTRMAKRGVIVRRLAAVEGLGSCTLIATDKTGTLTCNELTVRELVLPDGQAVEITGEGFQPVGTARIAGRDVAPGANPGLERLARIAVLCNEADLHARDGEWVHRGDTVDVAFLALGHKLGVTREALFGPHPLVAELPFEPERQFAATFHTVDGRSWAFVKGAPERILAMSRGGAEDKERWLRAAEGLAGRGFRVLALADGPMASLEPSAPPPTPSDLSFAGFAAMIDPLRPGVRDAVAACHDAGIRVSMITGDHKVTALAIGRELGIARDERDVLTGGELASFTPEALRAAVNRVSIFARVSPHQKLQLVKAARETGHFVAVTGDGVNDAPALREANLGVAMGKAGTDVAREAAELVLSDDNFTSIVNGVEEGRIAYDNIRKVIYLLVSTGAAEILLVTLTVATGYPIPLLPVQLLWLNLVTNGIQDVALAFEPGENDALKRPPRPPGDRVFNRLMAERTVVAGLVIGLVGFFEFKWMIDHGYSEAAARNSLLFLMVLFENVHIGNCRSETKSAFLLSPLRSPILLSGALTAFLLHVLAMHMPLMQRVLGTAPMTMNEWLALVPLALTVLVAMELHKVGWNARHRNRGTARWQPGGTVG